MTCMTLLIRQTLKRLNMTRNEIFMTVRKNTFSIKLPRGLEIVLKVNSRQNDVSFIAFFCKSVCRGTSYGHSATNISHPLCTLLVCAATFELPIKRNRRMIDFFLKTVNCVSIQNKKVAWI